MSYIIVGGSQRSGTSIMQQLLCQLPEANPYLYEASFLRELVTVYSQGRNNFDRNHDSYFASVQSVRDFMSGVVHAFVEQAARHVGAKEHLILKEPHLTMYWPFLFELLPEAWFVLMIRDPRDVIASMVKVGERQKQVGVESVFTLRDIPTLCKHFQDFYRLTFDFKNQSFRDRLGIVLYEDLAREPKATLKQLADFTGVPFDAIDPTAEPRPSLVDADVIRTDRMYSPWATEVSGAKLAANRVGNYRNVLEPHEIAQVEQHCGDFLQTFGYLAHAA